MSVNIKRCTLSMTLSDPNPVHGPPEITSILKFWDPVISLEEVKTGISVLVCSSI